MELLGIMLATITCLLCFLWWRPRSSGHNKLRLGPPGWPIVGNLVQVLLDKRPFMYVVSGLRAKYGPIYTIKMGQKTLVIVTSSKLIHEALIQKGANFASRPADTPIQFLFSAGKKAINALPYGPMWRTLWRNFVTELVSPSRIRQNRWIREWALKEHLKILELENSQKGFVDVMINVRLTICSILICLCFGAKLSKEKMLSIESVLKEVILMSTKRLSDFIPVLLLLPFFRRPYEAAKDLRRRQMECLVPLVRARRAFIESQKEDGANNRLQPDGALEMVSPVGAAYVDSLFDLKPPGHGRLKEEELVSLVPETINAGTDTSANMVEWAMFELVMNQDIQEKVYKEIVKKVGVNGEVQESDVEEMAYLLSVVKETFRRHPPSHFILSHATTEATELGGYIIPPNVNVDFYTAWVAKDPEAWEAPEKFRPERFLEGGDGVDVDITGKRGVNMMPFGAGRRICPAWSLGTLHVQLLVARMIHAFKWVPVAGNPPYPAEKFALTVNMKNPLKATILPRDKT
ncbi:cytochrome P450 77A3-like [Bidens hawaiensis]|uniref:cytochrome P450 77A3-like n=1 Tax=Bidens hawaiensis TaxID=980011 RepID=UPI004048EE05